MALLNTLITDRLNMERIRDMIVYILTTERDNQKALATAATLDPDLWDFKIVFEKSLPYMIAKMDTDTEPDTSYVNVWFDSFNTNNGTGDGKRQYPYSYSYNIDIISSKRPEETATGYNESDLLTAYEVQRVSRLVHSILLSGPYTCLNMKRVVMSRKIASIQTFQPDLSDRPAERVLGVRIKLEVNAHEFTPQYILIPEETGVAAPGYSGETVDSIGLTCTDDEGNTLFITEYDVKP